MIKEGMRVRVKSGEHAGRVGVIEFDRHPMRTTNFLAFLEEEGDKYATRINVTSDGVEEILSAEFTLSYLAEVLENTALARAGEGHTHNDGFGCDGHEEAFEQLAREVIERLS